MNVLEKTLISAEEIKKVEGMLEGANLALYEMTRDLRRNAFGNEPVIGAVEIYELVKQAGLTVVKQEIRSYTSPFKGEISGYLDGFNSETVEFGPTIYVNKQMDELARRYVIAHELGHYWINQIVGTSGKRTCSSTLFPALVEEEMCNKFASYLLLPIEVILKLLDRFVGENKERAEIGGIYKSEWLRYIAYEMNLSDQYTVIAYQDIRHLGGTLFARQFKGSNGETLMEDWERYRDYFR